MPTPAPIQPRQPDVVQASRLPSKKELVDPDETAGVEYGTTAKTAPRGTAKKTGTAAGTGTNGYGKMSVTSAKASAISGSGGCSPGGCRCAQTLALAALIRSRATST